jgi:hypothetical protein
MQDGPFARFALDERGCRRYYWAVLRAAVLPAGGAGPLQRDRDDHHQET